MKLTNEMKERIKEFVREEHKALKDNYNFETFKVNGKEINAMTYVPRSESQHGDYSPVWVNDEGFEYYLLYDLIPDDIDDNEKQELIHELRNYFESCCYNELTYCSTISRDAFGGQLEIATFDDCTEEELEEVKRLARKRFWGYGNKTVYP